MRLWDVVSGETVQVFAGHTKRVIGCAFSPDGKQVLSVSDDHTLRLWDVARGETVRVIEELVYSCAFSPDGRHILSEGYRMLHLLDVINGKMVRDFEVNAFVNGCTLSSDGRWALSASEDKALRLWDADSGEMVRIFTGHAAEVNGCAFSPDGRYALSASSDSTLRLWDVANGVKIRSFEIRRIIMGSYITTGDISGGTFSPNGRQVLFGSNDGALRLLDTASGAEVRVFGAGSAVGHQKRCAFSPDGRQILSAGNDLLLWNVTSGAVIRSFQGHSAEVNACTFSPDGRHALSASDDCTLRLWNVASGRELARWTTDTPLLCCAIGLDGETVIAGDNMGGLHFLSIVT